MESYIFQLWMITALFRFLGDSGHFALDDPLLDQFQRSFSRGTENVAAGMASAVAFATTKRRESFRSHMVPSLTDAQKRKLLSDPPFNQRDLFAPASVEAAREAARDVSLYRGAQSWPSTSSGTTQRRPFSSSSSYRGRPHSSPLSAPQRSPASSSSGVFSLRRNRPGGVSEVGACPLTQHRRLSRPFLASMGGSGSGCLVRGGLARGIQDPFLLRTSLVRPTPPHAILYPVFHREKPWRRNSKISSTNEP